MPDHLLANRLRAGLLSLPVVALLALGGEGPLRAQPHPSTPPLDTTALGPLQWRNIGPNRGGRSLACAGSPARPLEYYFGAVGGGLWKTTDGGTTWSAVTDGQVRSSSVGAIAVAESNPDVVYVGMGEVALRGNIMQGDGVYKSVDAGKTWRHMGLANSQVIARIRVHPTDADLVYVAAFGHPAGPSEERGIYRSKDGGATWERVLFRNASTGGVDLVIDRKNPSVLYAALWEAYRLSWQMSSGGPGSGLFKSSDGGTTWQELTRTPGMPRGVIGKIGVAVSPADPNRVYAIVEAEQGGVFRSDDAGRTWTRVSDDRRLRQRAFYYSRIYADPGDKDRLYVLNTRLYRSTDGGTTYKTVTVPHGDNHDLWIDPGNPQRLINSNDGGANVSFNGGESWTSQDYPTAQLYHIATTRDVPYHVCGAQQDNTTLCVPSDAGRHLRDPRRPQGDWLYAVGGGESGYVAPHPTDPDIFYAGSQGALLTWYNRRTGHIRDVQVYPRFFSGEPASALPERWQWTFPIVFSPHDANVLYTSSQHVWRTDDGGQSWRRISPDLTRADPKTLGDSGGPITRDMNGPEIFGTVFTIAPSRREAGTIWVGSDDGLVHVTRDEGATWTKVTPPDLPDFSRVSMIDASPHQPGTAYLAAKRYLLDDRAPYIYRTHDYGQTWTKIVSGIRADDYVHVVREDPTRPGLLYAGTEHGVWISFDDGGEWINLNLNLPDTQVADLVVEQHDLVAGTHGRSIYVLDDIGPLRQWNGSVTSAAVHLFEPRPATRSVSPAPIDYWLAKPAQKVTIDILDAAGAVVRSITGTPEDEEKKIEDAEGGPLRVKPPTTRAGLNRFTWDLRYEGATVWDGLIIWSARPEQGPVAVPGSYQVRLSVDGVRLTRPLEVRRDPRLRDVTDADLRAQFELALHIRDKTSEANQAVLDIRNLKAQLTDRVKNARSPAVGLAADVVGRRLTEVEEALYQTRNRSSQDPLNFPIRLNNRLAALRRSVETGDNRPTDAAHVVFKELSEELAAEMERLRSILGNEVAAFDNLIANGGLERLQLPATLPRP